jgi:hypothetical protein
VNAADRTYPFEIVWSSGAVETVVAHVAVFHEQRWLFLLNKEVILAAPAEMVITVRNLVIAPDTL